MRTMAEAYELLLHAMGWQERVAGEVASGQRQGWLPPGEHDGRPVVVNLDPEAEMPPGALSIEQAVHEGVLQALFGEDGRRFILGVHPGTNEAGDGVVVLTVKVMPGGFVGVPTGAWQRSLELGWGMNHGLMRETLINWAGQVMRDAPLEPELTSVPDHSDWYLFAKEAGVPALLSEAQRILDAGGKGSKARALRLLGLRV